MYQYGCDAYTKVEASRLFYFRLNQKKLRVDKYHGPMDFINSDSETGYPCRQTRNSTVIIHWLTTCIAAVASRRDVNSKGFWEARLLHYVHMQSQVEGNNR